MRLIEVVILAGSHCISPMQGGEGITEVVKVPCAVMVRHDAATDAVQIVPSAAAADPQVIAILVKPDTAPAAAMAEASAEVSPKGDRAMPEEEGGEVVPIAMPRVKPVSSEAAEQARDKTQSRVKRTKLADRCGSYRAVWYTAKGGHKRYRCVKSG